MSGSTPDLVWRRSGRCASNGCIEVAAGIDGVHLRDSHDPDGPQLIFPAAAWQAFLADVRAGRVQQQAG